MAAPVPRTRGRRRGAGAALALLLLLAAGGCTPAASGSKTRPHLLLVTMDTTRRDHCSVYGYARPTTPTLERLAREGARFDRAYAPSATTGPTHATLFTSQYPISHRVIKNGRVLDEGVQTLAEHLRSAGYQTAAIVSSFVLDRRFGYAQGFDVYRDEFTRQGTTWQMDTWEGRRMDGVFDRRAPETTDLAIEWLRGRADDRPFFLFVHYFDPHFPYVPDSSLLARFRDDASGKDPLAAAIAAYDAEIAGTDQQIGRLLDTLDGLGIAEETLVLVTADHGEGLMQHGYMYHGAQIWEEQVRVPLLLRWPGRIPPGRTLAGPVEFVDLAPTLLELMGLAAAAFDSPGRSLAGVLRGSETLPPDHPVFLHRRHFEPRTVEGMSVRGEKLGILLGRWKYVVGEAEQTRELYDLVRDPLEADNVVARRPEEAAHLDRRIAEWRRRYERPDPTRAPLSEDSRERLRALGYVE